MTQPLTNAELVAHIEGNLLDLGIVPVYQDLPAERSVSEMRRRRIPPEDDDTATLTLVDLDGVLRWQDGSVTATTLGQRMTRLGGGTPGEIVTQVKFAKPLGTSDIAKQLERFDQKLTPKGPGAFYELDENGNLVAIQAAPDGPVLLLVHGAFSSCDHIISGLKSSQGGDDLLKRARSKYAKVIAFEHFTVSRSPFVNAVEIARFFAGSTSAVDVVCHSRGGLVVRWWADALDRQARARRVVLVGCPLEGTSLADPASLRNGVDYLTNLGRALGTAVGLIPFLTVGAGILQIITSIGAFVAKAPLFDAALAMTPGLGAMSRTDNNFEIVAMNSYPLGATEYRAITSDFQPPDSPIWKFWTFFNKARVENFVADRLLFKEANDLVVDTSSMTHRVFGDVPLLPTDPRVCAFGPEEQVQHTDYFAQSRTVDFIAQALGV